MLEMDVLKSYDLHPSLTIETQIEFFKVRQDSLKVTL